MARHYATLVSRSAGLYGLRLLVLSWILSLVFGLPAMPQALAACGSCLGLLLVLIWVFRVGFRSAGPCALRLLVLGWILSLVFGLPAMPQALVACGHWFCCWFLGLRVRFLISMTWAPGVPAWQIRKNRRRSRPVNR